MAKKISFDNLPSAVGKILEILTSEEAGHAALPELVRRIAVLEKKIDHLQKISSPESAVMDMQTVCRVLKLRPKAVKGLAEAGILPYRTEGRKTLFYEDGVIKYYAAQPAWKAAAGDSKTEPASASDDSVPPEIADGERQRIGINAACGILDRSAAAIYQLAANDRVPHHKEGRKTFFYTDELREWAKYNPPLKRRK